MQHLILKQYQGPSKNILLHYGKTNSFCDDTINAQVDAEPSGRRSADDCDSQEIEIAAGEILQSAIATDTETNGNYPNHACQNWNIIADENQVYIFLQNKQFFHFGFQTTHHLYVVV